jgi:outer membrane cobalamin receptor
VSFAQSPAKRDSVHAEQHYTIDEVVVTGTKNEVNKSNLPMSISVVSRQQIDRSYESSLLPVLTEQVPGLFITSRSIMGYGVSAGAAGGMSMRGIGENPTTGLLVLIDGHPQYMGMMGHPLSDAYQSFLADRVEVVRGPASVLYGSNAMGGVINIVTRKAKEDGVTNNVRVGYGSFNTLTAEATDLVRKGRFNSVASVSYNRTDGQRANMDFNQVNGFLKLGYELNKAWSLSADANITHFNASNPGTVSEPLLGNDSKITRGMASIALENNYGTTSGALMLYSNWGRHDINDGHAPTAPPLDYRYNSTDNLQGVSLYQSASLFTGNRMTVGFDYQHAAGDAWNQYAASKTDIADKKVDEIAGYLDFRQSLGALVTLDAGLRADHYSPSGTVLIPQAGISFHLPRAAELKASVGKGFRNPTIRELYMFPPQNPGLLPEKLMNYEVMWSQYLMNGAFSYGVNVFYINGDNVIQTVFSNGRPININTGRIENKGVEANVAYRFGEVWTFTANYSWLDMKYPVVAAPEHKLFAGANFSKGKWMVSTGLQYVAGLYTSVGPDKRENFLLWNMRGSYRFCKTASLFLKGENLLAQSYEINAGYPMPKATVMGGFDLRF